MPSGVSQGTACAPDTGWTGLLASTASPKSGMLMLFLASLGPGMRRRDSQCSLAKARSCWHLQFVERSAQDVERIAAGIQVAVHSVGLARLTRQPYVGGPGCAQRGGRRCCLVSVD